MNSAELELLCSALSIREKERPVGMLDNNLKVKGERVLSLCLVGKVLTTRVVNKEAFISVMNSIWRTSEGVEIEALEGDVFAFHFKNSEDRKYIQSGGPWTFDRALTALEEPTGAGDIALMKFNKANELGQSGVTAQVDMDLPIESGPIAKIDHMHQMTVDQIYSSSPTFDPTQSSKFPDPNIMASSSSSILPISKIVKWKRAAHSKGGLSDLGEINSLGKMGSLVLEDVVQFTSKRAKDGLSECGDAVRLAEGNFSLDNTDNVVGGFVTVAVEGVDTAAFSNLEAIRQVVT
ncbi:hypothetical protein Q3G72_000485 [Acer saccharum]|nr:hypothetical protein Q3G72_000485 [Acer saccharum]